MSNVGNNAETLRSEAGASAERGLSSSVARSASAVGDQLGLLSGGGSWSSSNPWRGCEAYHVLMLCHQQIYNRQYDLAVRSAIRLCDYDDLVDPRTVYSLLALTAFHTRLYKQCSRAFIKLRNSSSSGSGFTRTARRNLMSSLPLDPSNGATITSGSISAAPKNRSNDILGSSAGGLLGLRLTKKQEQFERLASKIFREHPPRDTVAATVPCPSCSKDIDDWRTSCPHCHQKFTFCVSSGRSIFVLGTGSASNLTSTGIGTGRGIRQSAAGDFAECRTCRRKMYANEAAGRLACPLCHARVG